MFILNQASVCLSYRFAVCRQKIEMSKAKFKMKSFICWKETLETNLTNAPKENHSSSGCSFTLVLSILMFI